MADQDTFLLLYDYVPDMGERRMPYREEHLARIYAERDAGRLLLAGGTGAPISGGALVFQGVTPNDVEAFVEADPYMQAGLITSHRILPWLLV